MVDDYRSFLEKMISGAEPKEGTPTGRIPRAIKNRQMNVRVTQELYARVRALACRLGVSIPVLVEVAIHTLEEKLT